MTPCAVLLYAIECWLRLLGPIENLPAGYLFLCPLAELETDVPTCFVISDCPAYWSVDPSGVERLSEQAAKNLGFPKLTLRVEVWARSWDNDVYDGIRQFHEAKGFHPYTQAVAVELGYPLFQASCEHRESLIHGSCLIQLSTSASAWRRQ